MIRPGRHLILDDRDDSRLFVGDEVTAYTDRGEEVQGPIRTISAYGIGIETAPGDPLRALPYKWIDAVVKEAQDVESWQ